MQNIRIIFMGTPSFAVASLKKLIEHSYSIVAVVTAPDNPRGRGQRITCSPVKACAQQNNIPVLQPKRLKDPDFIHELKKYRANLHIVVAFRMLPEIIWSMPSYGTFNLHASLLPHYRGAAPINWAIIHGEKETGLTTFFINQHIDTGTLIMQEKEPIFDHDTAGSLHDRLMKKGATLVLHTVHAITTKNYTAQPQQEVEHVKVAPKIFPSDCQLDLHKNPDEIRNFVRGLNPYPAAWVMINGIKFKIFSVTIAWPELPKQHHNALYTDHKNYLCLKVKNGWIAIEELQAEGKKRMDIKAFLRGNKIANPSP